MSFDTACLAQVSDANDTDVEDLFDPRPVAPQPSDCCGTGCCPCVHDIYQQDLKDWNKRCDCIRRGECGEGTSVGSNELGIFKDQFTMFKLIEIRSVSADTSVYVFHMPNNRGLNLEVGQHLILKQMNESGKSITRQYTPISELKEYGKFDVLIKLYEKGKITRLIKKWKVGDTIPWRGPFGRFSYSSNSFRRILVFGAGTGVAPLYQVIRHILSDPNEEARLLFLYSSKSFDDILLRGELLELTSHWNFDMKHYLSNESKVSQRKYREQVQFRRLTKTDIKEVINEDSLAECLILVCGTKSFEKDVINCAKDLEIPDSNIFKF